MRGSRCWLTGRIVFFWLPPDRLIASRGLSWMHRFEIGTDGLGEMFRQDRGGGGIAAGLVLGKTGSDFHRWVGSWGTGKWFPGSSYLGRAAN